MQKWEYYTLTHLEHKDPVLIDFLNDMGNEGWELVNSEYHDESAIQFAHRVLIFKRPKLREVAQDAETDNT